MGSSRIISCFFFVELLILSLLVFDVPCWGKDLAGTHPPVANVILWQNNVKISAGVTDVPVTHRKKIVRIDAPGDLTEADTEYLLINDVIAKGTAFTIKNSNITLNLNGHSVTYNDEEAGVGPKDVYGLVLSVFNLKDVSIVNGSIIQGKGNGGGNPVGWGHNPVFAQSPNGLEIAGIKFVYSGKDITGIYIHYGKNIKIHHNTINDLGSIVSNRHQGIDAIKIMAENSIVNNNLVVRCRHRAISVGSDSEVYANEIHIDSQVTNSYGLMCYKNKNFQLYNNVIYGKGVHPVGIGVIAGAANGKVFNNYVEVQSTQKGEEYGDTGAACFRTTWGADNLEVFNNTFTLYASENYMGTNINSWGRALWIGLPEPSQKVTFSNNKIVALNNDGRAKAAAVAIVCNNESGDLILRNNTIVSNWGNILLTDSYGYSDGFARFIDNTIVRFGDYPSYRTIRSQYRLKPSTAKLISNSFENGASINSLDIDFNSPETKEIAVGWHLSIDVIDASGQVVRDASVSVQDCNQQTVYMGTSSHDGCVEIELVEYVLTNDLKNTPMTAKTQKTQFNKRKVNPHIITVTKNGKSVNRTVEVMDDTHIQIVL